MSKSLEQLTEERDKLIRKLDSVRTKIATIKRKSEYMSFDEARITLKTGDIIEVNYNGGRNYKAVFQRVVDPTIRGNQLSNYNDYGFQVVMQRYSRSSDYHSVVIAHNPLSKENPTFKIHKSSNRFNKKFNVKDIVYIMTMDFKRYDDHKNFSHLYFRNNVSVVDVVNEDLFKNVFFDNICVLPSHFEDKIKYHSDFMDDIVEYSNLKVAISKKTN